MLVTAIETMGPEVLLDKRKNQSEAYFVKFCTSTFRFKKSVFKCGLSGLGDSAKQPAVP